MSYLLNASALILLLLDLGEEILQIATKTQLYIADLTLYEIGNGLWKLVTLLRTMALENALELINILRMLIMKKLLKSN